MEVFAEVSIDAHEAEAFLRVDGWVPIDAAEGSIGITVGWPVGVGAGRGYIAIAPDDAERVASQLLEAVDDARAAGWEPSKG